MILTDLLRRVIRSARIQRAALASGALEDIARHYVAGQTVAEARDVARELRGKGLEVAFSYLPTSDSEAESPGALRRLLEVLGEEAQGAELSIKPSQIGLRSSQQGAEDTLRRLADDALQAGALVTLEMQGHAEYAETLRLWRTAREDYPDLGITLPVDILRAERDVRAIADESPRLRLCIGSYPVPRALGIQKEHDKSRALVRCLRIAMERGARTHVASHDPTIIAIVQELGRRNPQALFEFQMFYGVRPLEQRRLTDIGYRSRVLIPFGPGWFEYLMTRVTTRPQTAIGYLRAVLDKR